MNHVINLSRNMRPVFAHIELVGVNRMFALLPMVAAARYVAKNLACLSHTCQSGTGHLMVAVSLNGRT